MPHQHCYTTVSRYSQKLKLKWCTALYGNPSQSHGASPAIWDHTVLPANGQGRTRPALTPARQTSTLFTYLARMESHLRTTERRVPYGSATRHRWTCPALTQAKQAGTRFSYPGGMTILHITGAQGQRVTDIETDWRTDRETDRWTDRPCSGLVQCVEWCHKGTCIELRSAPCLTAEYALAPQSPWPSRYSLCRHGDTQTDRQTHAYITVDTTQHSFINATGRIQSSNTRRLDQCLKIGLKNYRNVQKGNFGRSSCTAFCLKITQTDVWTVIS